MGAFRRVAGQLPQVPPDRLHLPDEPLPPVGIALGQREHAADQARDHVRPERQARGRLAIVLPLAPGTLEK